MEEVILKQEVGLQKKDRAVIEEGIMDYDVASGYTIISSKNICFPFRKQKMRDDLVGFIVGYQSMGECQKELDLLCSQPRQEIDNYKNALSDQIKIASSGMKYEHLAELFIKHHWSEEGVRNYVLENFQEKGRDWLNNEVHRKAQPLVDQLSSYVKNFNEERMKEMVNMIEHNFNDWQRKNLAQFYHKCSNASFYGDGYWMARIIVPDGMKPNRKMYFTDNNKAEDVLEHFNLPFQVLEIKY